MGLKNQSESWEFFQEERRKGILILLGETLDDFAALRSKRLSSIRTRNLVSFLSVYEKGQIFLLALFSNCTVSATEIPVSTTMSDPPKRVVSEGFITYAYILLYIALSSGQIFFNKVHPISFS